MEAKSPKSPKLTKPMTTHLVKITDHAINSYTSLEETEHYEIRQSRKYSCDSIEKVFRTSAQAIADLTKDFSTPVVASIQASPTPMIYEIKEVH